MLYRDRLSSVLIPSNGTGTKTAGNLLAKQREVAVIFLLAVDAACDPID